MLRLENFKRKQAEKTEPRKTEFDDEFNKMQELAISMEKNFRHMNEALDYYLTPKSGDRLKKTVYGKLGIVDANSLKSQDQYKMAESMAAIGEGIGESTSLGSMYLAAADAQKEIIHAWMRFQGECEKSYIKPMSLLSKELNMLKRNLQKIERDRLYLDSQKGKGVRALHDLNHFDPSVVQHYNDKAAKLQENLTESACSAQKQMEHFFYEMEEDQMLVLFTFISLV
ncbi:uncharacterized protein LOC135146667 [Zophobas morio]|uniref:uncharacterized protein LOC135146667 n=1 Tax=Zophobas morio TaxID=2755281 RepID=UPI0030831480